MISASTSRRTRRGMVREWRLHALSVFSLAVAFVCLGAALLVVTNLRSVEDRWAHAGRATIYLKDSASQQEVAVFKEALARVPGVTNVRYVSSGQARTEFGAEEGSTPDGKRDGTSAAEGGGVVKRNELLALPVDAFPASLEVEVRADMGDAELADMVSKLKQLPA